MEQVIKDIKGLDVVKTIRNALSDIDNRILIACGCVMGSYAAYETLESLSRAGASQNQVIKFLHSNIRKMYNCGMLMKMRDFYYDRSTSMVNYGSYGLTPKPVFDYRIALLV